MLAILTLSHITALAFVVKKWLPKHENLQDILMKSSRLLGLSEAIVITVTTFAFLIQLHLLQLHWTAKVTWTTKKKMLVVLLPIYVAGALLVVVQSCGVPRRIHVILKYYARLVRDGFLMPRILLIVVADSKQKALSSYFYIGISVIRLLPHVHDIHSARHYYPSERFLEYYQIDVPEEHELFYQWIMRPPSKSWGCVYHALSEEIRRPMRDSGEIQKSGDGLIRVSLGKKEL